MLPVSRASAQVRFQMQPATQGRPAAAPRGGFSQKLGQARTGGPQTAQQPDEAKAKIRKRKAAPQFNQQTDLEIEARMLEQQRQAQRDARPALGLRSTTI